MTALKTKLFHDEITDNFDVASCTQKIASWDTIRSSSEIPGFRMFQNGVRAKETEADIAEHVFSKGELELKH